MRTWTWILLQWRFEMRLQPQQAFWLQLSGETLKYRTQQSCAQNPHPLKLLLSWTTKFVMVWWHSKRKLTQCIHELIQAHTHTPYTHIQAQMPSATDPKASKIYLRSSCFSITACHHSPRDIISLLSTHCFAFEVTHSSAAPWAQGRRGICRLIQLLLNSCPLTIASAYQDCSDVASSSAVLPVTPVLSASHL